MSTRRQLEPVAHDFLDGIARTPGRLPAGGAGEAPNRISFRTEGEDLADGRPLLDACDTVEAPLVEHHPSEGQPDAVEPEVLGCRPRRLPATAGGREEPFRVVIIEDRHHFALRRGWRGGEIEPKQVRFSSR